MARNEKWHRARHDRRTGGFIPDIREAAYILSLYIQWYGRQPHDGLGGRCPEDVLAEGLGPGIDPAELGSEFLWAKKVTPRRCRITLYGIDYESDCLYGWNDELIAKYDTSDLGKVYLHTTDGACLGEALPVSALSPIAKMLGGEVASVDQVKAAIKRQHSLAKQTKRNLTELGAGPDAADSINVLPYSRKVAVLPAPEPGGGVSPQAKPAAEEMEPAEKARLELVVSNAEAEIRQREEAGPVVERPEYWRSEHDRYEWAWRAVHQHKMQISNEDRAYMAYFEQTVEFQENYAGWYRSLAELYAG
jgi:putative transposase